MGNQKEKAKNFWEENKTKLIAVGVGVTAAVTGMYIFNKGYRAGFTDGGAFGFLGTLDWLDKTFPGESKANELWNIWCKENPDKVRKHTVSIRQ